MNLVVFVSDALRTDHLGCYGARFLNTHTVDELAAAGVRFDQAISAAPWTCPSMTSMVTGLYPHHHGFLHWDAPAPTAPTLFSAAAGANHAVGTFVFDEGYLFKGLPDANVLGTSERLDGAVEWLRAHRDRPFLLFIHSWATHMPYDIIHAERRQWRAAKQELMDGIRSDSAGALERVREAYRRAVETMSEGMLADLLSELESLGLRDRTAIAFLSDHGESWGERFADKQDVKGIYHMHGSALYEEVVQVPLIVSAPERLQPAVVRCQVRTIDLLPTLLELGGLPDQGSDGASLLPPAAGSEHDDRPALIVGTDGGALSQIAVRVPPWKLIRQVESGREEAFRLDLDPREQRPTEPPAELRRHLDEALESMQQPVFSAEEAATIEARLADLGYI